MNLVRIISLSLVTKSYLQISEGKLNIQVQAINGIAFLRSYSSEAKLLCSYSSEANSLVENHEWPEENIIT